MSSDSFAMPAPHSTARRMGRSITAVLAGLVAIFVLSIGTDQVLHALDVYPPWGEPMVQTELLLLALGYRLVFDTFGCWLAARLAPHSAMLHALILGGIGFVLSTAGAIAMWDMGPNWYPVVLALSAPPSAWLGGRIAQR